METKNGPEEKDGGELRPEWEKPTVKELDIHAITMGNAYGPNDDGGLYTYS